MTANELISYEMDMMKGQVSACCNGLTEEGYNWKLNDTAMSIREMCEHLAECYTAYLAHCAGTEHSWGTFQLNATSGADAFNKMMEHREKAVATANGTEDDDHMKNAVAYITAHDSYHVGQMALTRISNDSSWDAYAIYA